jgi:altronate dehydratase
MTEAPVIRIAPADNVAVARVDLSAGDQIRLGELACAVRTPVPAGHKVALADIPLGGSVVKYGEIIGRATRAIRAGEHVHLHNLESRRGGGGGVTWS